MSGAAAPIEVFLSHAEKDRGLCEELEKHLAMLEREGLIRPWSSRQIGPGDDWRAAVGEHLERADLIVLLLSADFFASDACFDVEVERALARAERGRARVIAVRARPYDWGSVRFDRVPVLPENGDPITSWPDRDAAWAEVVRGIRCALTAGLAPSPRIRHELPPRRRFFGRESELRRVAEALAAPRPTEGALASIWGLGGAGKTALALEYAHRVLDEGSHPAGVFWLPAAGDALEVMVRLAGLLHRHRLIDVPMPASADDLAAAARRALSALAEPSLLVLDDVSEPGLADQLPGGLARVLVTTRDRRLSLGARVDLDVLSTADARRLAVERVGRPARDQDEDEALGRVVERRLGGLALAIEVAADAVRDWALDWATYERHLAAQPEEALADPLGGDAPSGVFAALDLSLDRCDATARRLLAGAVAFAPDAPVPLVWAFFAAELSPEGMAAQKALGQLEGLGLAKVDRRAGTLALHALVRARVSARAPLDPSAASAPARAMQQVARWIERVSGPTREAMEEIDARRAQLDAAMLAAERAGDPALWSQMADHLASHLRNRARHHEARALFARVLSIEESLHGPTHPRVASALSNLAMELKELGKPAEAKPLLERALLLDRQGNTPDHTLATHLSNLALVLRDMGEPRAALPLLHEAVALDEKAARAGDPDALKRLSNLGLLLLALGQARAALPHFERALPLLEEAYGRDHPNVAVVLANLATALRSTGKSSLARPLLERCLAIDEAAFGPEHPSVARDLSNLALVLNDLGDPGSARAKLQRAVAIAEGALGPSHPSTKVMRANLGSIEDKLGRG
jgi:tetratricopeptide (TPR) repeat protein